MSEDLSEVSRETGLQAAFAVVEEVLRHLGGAFTVEVSRDELEDLTTLVISGPDATSVIGRHGDTLDALEHILNRIAAGTPGVPGRIAVDVDGYRGRRRESLEDLARRFAEKALSTGSPVTLHPMSPRDRRIVHLALADWAAVSTHSEGDGRDRRVVIEPASQSPSR